MKNRKRLRLMSKLMVYFLILIILPVSIVGLYSYNNTKKALKEEAEQTLKSELNKVVDEIGLRMNSIEELGSILSELPAIIDYSNEVKSGEITSSTLALTQKTIKEFGKSISDISESISIVDKYGKVKLDSIGNSSVGLDLSQRQYFKESIVGKNYWSEVVSSKLTSEPIIVYSLPLRTNNKETVGIIAIAIKFETIANILKEVKVGDTGYAYMINRSGLVLQHPVADKILKENMLEIKDNEILTSQIKKMTEGEEGKGYYTYEGVYKFNLYKPVGNWSVTVNIPVEEYMEASVEIGRTSLTIAVIGIIIGILIAYVVSKQITKPIKKLMDLMSKMENGDLMVASDIKNKDEIGDLSNSFNNMVDGQKHAIEEVFHIGKQVERSSEETSGTSEEIASSAQSQATLIQELANAMNEMSRSIGQVADSATEMAHNTSNINNSMNELEESANEVAKITDITAENIVDITGAIRRMNTSLQIVADNTNNASKEAVKTVEVAEDGKKAVTNTISEMDKINKGMEELTQVIKGLGNAAVQIGDIVEVIDDIAEQTNLLSLNASIEAARAGEHGKGFAVVAGAIGALSEKSSEATKDITNLIRNIQEQVGNAVNTVSEGAKQVNNGVDLVKNTGVALDKIFEDINATTKLIKDIALSTDEQTIESKAVMKAIEKVNELSSQVSTAMQNQINSINSVVQSVDNLNTLSQEVASAAEEQAAASQEVVATTESINEITKEVSAGSQEVAATSEDLAQQANNLTQVISRFKIQ